MVQLRSGQPDGTIGSSFRIRVALFNEEDAEDASVMKFATLLRDSANQQQLHIDSC